MESPGQWSNHSTKIWFTSLFQGIMLKPIGKVFPHESSCITFSIRVNKKSTFKFSFLRVIFDFGESTFLLYTLSRVCKL